MWETQRNPRGLVLSEEKGTRTIFNHCEGLTFGVSIVTLPKAQRNQ